MPTSYSFNIFSLFIHSSLLVKLVILILLGISIMSWAIAIDRFTLYRNILRHIYSFEKCFWESKSLDKVYSIYKAKENNSDISLMFIAAMKELSRLKRVSDASSTQLNMRIDNAMELIISRTEQFMNKYVAFLATVSSTAPFIGLFGTVIGIMTSFSSIAATQNTSLAVVAPGIAEALLATAIGLFAAIPAAIMYNRLVDESNAIIDLLEYSYPLVKSSPIYYRGRLEV